RTVRWKDEIVGRLTRGVAALLKKNGVRAIKGWARVIDGKTVEVSGDDGATRITCEHLLLAAGSREVELPGLPFGGSVVSSTMALSPTSLPRRLAVIGAGYIGLELGVAYRKLGADVIVIEALERVLPAYDADLVKPVAAALKRFGIEVRVGSTVESLDAGGDAVRVKDARGDESQIACDRVLVAVGRRPHTEGWGLESLML